jgi:hypothetical protein
MNPNRARQPDDTPAAASWSQCIAVIGFPFVVQRWLGTYLLLTIR